MNAQKSYELSKEMVENGANIRARVSENLHGQENVTTATPIQNLRMVAVLSADKIS